MNRRELIKTLGASAAAASLAACGAKQVAPRYRRPLSHNPFIAPDISEDRVIRSVVGLRPYRASGFVVKSEKFDDKTIIHNYGHGGGGISLSWGSSALAVYQAPIVDVDKRQAAVIGSGVMGLTTARLLQDAGWQVTIYTRKPARHSVSNVAGGLWEPTSVFDETVASEVFKTQFKWAAKISHHAFTNLGGADYGVRWLENYIVSDEPIESEYVTRELPELFAYTADLKPGEHPFAASHVHRNVTMLIEPAIFLRQITEDFFQAGGQYETRNFENIDQVLSLKESAIFNCSGLGSRELFGDEELMPVRGQLVYMVPDPAVDYIAIGGKNLGYYMFPRTDVMLLGGTWGKGDWNRQPTEEDTRRIIAENRKIFEDFG